jgi:hypothetical protein
VNAPAVPAVIDAERKDKDTGATKEQRRARPSRNGVDWSCRYSTDMARSIRSASGAIDTEPVD